MEGKRKGGKTGGRKAGTPNKVTAVTREVWSEVLKENLPYLQETLDRLRRESPKEWVNAVIKINEFVVPKMASVSVSAEGKKSDLRSEILEMASQEEE